MSDNNSYIIYTIEPGTPIGYTDVSGTKQSLVIDNVKEAIEIERAIYSNQHARAQIHQIETQNLVLLLSEMRLALGALRVNESKEGVRKLDEAPALQGIILDGAERTHMMKLYGKVIDIAVAHARKLDPRPFREDKNDTNDPI